MKSRGRRFPHSWVWNTVSSQRSLWKEELKKWVAKAIGSLAKPDDIRLTDTLPKTRSGKIMRRLLRELASSGEVKGDTTTLEDFGVIAKLRGDRKTKEQDEV
jgi:acyl-CoA synthetase (AMP-forming)/AMP-acid ligase II